MVIVASPVREAVRSAPVRRAAAQVAHEVGRLAPELREQQLAEEVVEAVPLPLPVERHEERVRPLQRLQQPLEHLNFNVRMRVSCCTTSEVIVDEADVWSLETHSRIDVYDAAGGNGTLVFVLVVAALAGRRRRKSL